MAKGQFAWEEKIDNLVARLRSRHPLQYGYRDEVIVFDPGDDPTIEERFNRCPNCEQWSPCDIRQLLDIISSKQLSTNNDA